MHNIRVFNRAVALVPAERVRCLAVGATGASASHTCTGGSNFLAPTISSPTRGNARKYRVSNRRAATIVLEPIDKYTRRISALCESRG